MTDKEKTLALTYPQPRIWAKVDSSGNLVSFSLTECMRASQSGNGEVAVYAAVILQVLKLVCEDEDKLSSLLEFDKELVDKPTEEEQEE